MKLNNLGFDQWFEAHAVQSLQEGEGIARVSAVDRGSYLIRNESGEVPAELAGRLAYQRENPTDLPCVGDWVRVMYYDNDWAAIIHGVLPRKSFLRRKTAGAEVDFQLIAANIDTAFIVQSCHFDFNPRRLERYLVMAADGGVEPVVVLTKIDLIGQEELEQKLAVLSTVVKSRVLAFSSLTGSRFYQFQQTLSPQKTYCLLGSSGVGKTTLINRLIGQEAFDTKPVSGTGEGTHTTSRRRLIVLHQGAILIDTPGMREVGIIGADAEVDQGFEEFSALAEQCRYPDCSHEHEPGCAVRTAVECGTLSEDRYASFLKLKKESQYYEMSYLDRRKKDKQFGRLVKSVKKRRED